MERQAPVLEHDALACGIYLETSCPACQRGFPAAEQEAYWRRMGLPSPAELERRAAARDEEARQAMLLDEKIQAARRNLQSPPGDEISFGGML